ncbi:DNA glycosylase [Mycena sanguinolenta]|uniref:DNA-(apurinic or apyrimidinic site) lyase n=1 Tax=Mycena sanguinolenta TaxID=230812 RepID=A0A8H6YP13_9AGAR|nr:DNA glycosylase [Mycena sanguinolenta]
MQSFVKIQWQSLALPQSQLCLAAVLKCGQSFRWMSFGSAPTEEYHLCLADRVVCLKQDPTTLFYRTLLSRPQPSALPQQLADAETLVWLKDYFQLDVDLQKLYAEWAIRDKVFSSIETRFAGIRMLRQDPFENLISFICSSNNNIGRITKMVHALCKHYSPLLLSMPNPSDPLVEVPYHPFPSPTVLAAPDVEATLRDLGFGYRAKFIQKTAQMLVETHGSGEQAERFLAGLRTASTGDAREELLKLMGVGRKVADCVLLMSLDKHEVVPVDTHVHQIAIKHYGLKGSLNSKTAMTPKLYEEINTKLVNVWGDYAGWAHSVLFTSDLKAFSTHGVEPAAAENALPTPPPTPSPRKRKSNAPDASKTSSQDDALPSSSLLAPRLKRRRTTDTTIASS